MKTATVTYFKRKKYEVLMAEQQYKIVGLKGYGGVVEDESILSSACREIAEETGVVKELRLNPDEDGGIYVLPEDLKFMGIIDFYNGTEEEVPFGDPSFHVIFYQCDTFLGKAISTKEMFNPDWYDINNLMFDKMIPGDNLFLSQMFKGELLKGYIRRTSDWKTILDYYFEPCIEKDLDI